MEDCQCSKDRKDKWIQSKWIYRKGDEYDYEYEYVYVYVYVYVICEQARGARETDANEAGLGEGGTGIGVA